MRSYLQKYNLLRDNCNSQSQKLGLWSMLAAQHNVLFQRLHFPNLFQATLLLFISPSWFSWSLFLPGSWSCQESLEFGSHENNSSYFFLFLFSPEGENLGSFGDFLKLSSCLLPVLINFPIQDRMFQSGRNCYTVLSFMVHCLFVCLF